MKRTAEFVLLWIGLVISVLLAGLGALMTKMVDDPQLMKDTYDSMPSMYGSYDEFTNAVSDGGKLLLIWGIVLVVAAIISMILLKGNKKPKISGIILIVAAVVATIITAFATVLPAIFFVVAGIMALVRKPVKMIESPDRI